MDNQTSQTNNQTPLPNPTSSVTDSGYLVSEQVDPNRISNDQLASDLEALKKSEVIIPSDSVISNKDQEEFVEYDPNKSQVSAALELKNPFRGE